VEGDLLMRALLDPRSILPGAAAVLLLLAPAGSTASPSPPGEAAGAVERDPGGASGAASPESLVVSVRVTGVASMTSGDARALVGLEPGDRFSRARLDEGLARLLDALGARGRLAAAASADVALEGRGVGVHVSVREGPEARIAAFALTGVTAFSPAEIEKTLRLSPGCAFDPRVLDGSIRRFVAAYDRRGYPFAAVRPAGFRLDGDSLSFALLVREGPRATVEGFRTEGLEETRPGTIERIAGIRPGEPYDGARRAEGEKRLRRSGLFASVDELRVEPGSADDLVRLAVRVRERTSSAAEGILAWSERRDGGGRLGGSFRLSLRNLAGTARRAEASWQGEGDRALYALAYEEPWLLGTPLRLEGSFRHRLADSTSSATALALRAGIPAGLHLSFSGGVERERGVATRPVPDRWSRTSLLLGAAFDSRDEIVFPSAGLHVRAESRAGRRSGGGAGDAEGAPAPPSGSTMTTGFSLDLEAYLPGPARTTLALRGAGRTIRNADGVYRRTELFPLGGARSLRGYREEQFRSSSTGLVQTEIRLRLDPDGSRAYLFLDAGVVDRAHYEAEREAGPGAVKPGYGFGLALAGRAGLVAVEYGLGEGNGPLSGRIHLTLASAF
jgi:outer membrane protein assembly factor BamA